MRAIVLLGAVILFLSGCAHVVSKDLRDRADRDVPLSALFQDPEGLQGRIVIIGGIIATSLNTQEGTSIEVVQQPLDFLGRPRKTDQSLGRFLVVSENFLDPVIYAQGRPITVAGEVLGRSVKPLQGVTYSYPLIQARELHLIRPGYGMPVHIGVGVGVAID